MRQASLIEGTLSSLCSPYKGKDLLKLFGQSPEMKYSNNLKALRKAKKWTYEQAANGMGMSYGGYMKIERGENRLTSTTISLASKAFEVSEGDIVRLGESEQAEPQKALTDYIIEVDIRAGAGGGGIPVEAWHTDGNGNNYQIENTKAHWQLPKDVMREMLRSPAEFIRAFEVMGNSMEPRLNNGDRVFVDTRYREPHPEGIFALWDGYGVVIKQLQIIRGSDPLAVRIISINTSYAPYDAQVDEINIIGRYAGRFTVS